MNKQKTQGFADKKNFQHPKNKKIFKKNQSEKSNT